MFQTNAEDKIKKDVSRSITLFRKSCRLWDNVEKYRKDKQVTSVNTNRRNKHAICMWDN
jgi:hypothetical protein